MTPNWPWIRRSRRFPYIWSACSPSPWIPSWNLFRSVASWFELQAILRQSAPNDPKRLCTLQHQPYAMPVQPDTSYPHTIVLCGQRISALYYKIPDMDIRPLSVRNSTCTYKHYHDIYRPQRPPWRSWLPAWFLCIITMPFFGKGTSHGFESFPCHIDMAKFIGRKFNRHFIIYHASPLRRSALSAQ